MNKVFICHGHDSVPLRELSQILRGLELDPIILSEQDDRGFTIIEKFEHFGERCKFAFALLTPDDRQAHEPDKPAGWRARQNVILELGWFMRKLGRKGVALLYKGDVEIPSDLNGVLYLRIESTVYEVNDAITQRLKGQGLIP